jgi:outer membrane lipoprotein SlyB
MTRSPRFLPLAAALALVVAVPACAPSNTGSTVSASGMGVAAAVSHGTIVSTRQVQVEGRSGGVGGVGGAVAGGLVGSTIGGDWRAQMLAGVGGALVGGLVGSTAERSLSSGTATAFTVREDRGGEFEVVQTNEEGLQVGDRVQISRGDRVRLSRSTTPPPAGSTHTNDSGASQQRR